MPFEGNSDDSRNLGKNSWSPLVKCPKGPKIEKIQDLEIFKRD